MQVLCEGVTYSNWPWGKQTCNLKFGSWAHDSHSYDLQFYDDQVRRGESCSWTIPVQAEMDLRQFGEYNQFKILRQTATRESKRYYSPRSDAEAKLPGKLSKYLWCGSFDLYIKSYIPSKTRKVVLSTLIFVMSHNATTTSIHQKLTILECDDF